MLVSAVAVKEGVHQRKGAHPVTGNKMGIHEEGERGISYRLPAKAAAGGRPDTSQNWGFPPRGQADWDSALYDPDSRCRRTISLCSSPHLPFWKEGGQSERGCLQLEWTTSGLAGGDHRRGILLLRQSKLGHFPSWPASVLGGT